uniref:Mitochondrial potassium channel ATP-binding subunit n=1 Tax=Strigamia maritima TaxID=126957 RepID=T1J598_STRMM
MSTNALLSLCGRKFSQKLGLHSLKTGLRVIRNQLENVKPFNKLKPSLKNLENFQQPLKYGFFIFSSCGVVLVKNSFALCEENRVKNRLAHYETLITSDDQLFDWKKLGELLAPDKWLLILAVACAIIVAIINIRIPLLIGELANIVSDYSGKRYIPGRFMERLKPPSFILLFLYCIQACFTTVYIATLAVVGEELATRMRQELFSSILKQDIAFFDTHKTGELINRLTTDVQDFKSAFKSCVSQGLKNVTQTAGCFVSLYMISPKMTALIGVILPAIIFAGSAIGTVLRVQSKKAHAQVEKSTSVADEAIGNIRTVRAFAMEEKEISLYNAELDKASVLNKQLGIGIGIFQGLSNLAINGIVLCVICVGGLLVQSQEISRGELLSFLVAAQTIQRSLGQLSLLLGHFVRGATAGNRVFEYIKLDPAVKLKGGITIPHHSLVTDIQFKDVTFSYPARPGHVVLKNFSLKIPPGKVVALCGISGSGKSTVATLLERFYDVKEGCITLDGHDIRTLDPSWLRGQVIGFISQEPVLFATSILENIRYGKPKASDKEVIEAAQMANAHDFIIAFPKGYATVLGERGVTISGGQKQRIAIARAFLKNPAILILDEATSALDAESEKIVQTALDKIVKGRTVLVIAHRLSTIQNADVIAVLADGIIAEMGTHEKLKIAKGLYWDLIKQQQTVEALKAKTPNKRQPPPTS